MANLCPQSPNHTTTVIMSIVIMKYSYHSSGFFGVGCGGLALVTSAKEPTMAVDVAVLKTKVPFANASVAVADGIPQRPEAKFRSS